MAVFCCPECGRPKEKIASKPQSNSQREISMTIPEHHWPIFKMVFDRMNVQFGMRGLGEFANILPEYGDQIPLEFKKFRYFEDASLAYAYLAIERGYSIKTLIEKGGRPDFEGNERFKVVAEFARKDEEKNLHLTLSDCAPEDAAKDVCAHLKDMADRYAATP